MKLSDLRILRKLATGGMAELFVARQTMIDGIEREVVLKRILPEHAANPEFVTAFLNEARLVAQLNHPNIVQFYDVGKDGKTYFSTMEYLRGADLALLIELQKSEGAFMPLAMVICILSDVLAGLDHAHHAADLDGRPLGIVHRDLTPGNIIVLADGRSKIIDFGIAKAMAKNEKRTATGTVKGKLEYLAPEQVLGISVDRRADVFSVGILAYELFTNTHPFLADTDYGTLRNVLEANVAPLSDVRPDLPAALSDAVARALARSLAERFDSAADFRDALREAAGVAERSVVQRYLLEKKNALEKIESVRRGSSFNQWREKVRSHWWRAAMLIVLAGAGVWFFHRLLVHSPLPVIAMPASQVLSPTAVSPTVVSPTIISPTVISPTVVPAPSVSPAPKKLAPVDNRKGRLRLIVEPWAFVRINNQDVGVTPLAVRELKPGRYTITLTNPGLHKNEEHKVVVRADEELVVRVSWQ